MFYRILFVLLFFAACGGGEQSGIYTAYSPRQIAENIIAEQENIAEMNYMSPDGEFFWDFVTDRYRIDTNKIADGVIFYAGGVIVDEITVLRLSDKAYAPAVRDLLLEYADRRRIAFSGYAPVQAGIIANAVVSVNGDHIALFITEDPRGAEASFLACFTDTPPPEPQPTPTPAPNPTPPPIEEDTPLIYDDAYDRRAVLHAWETGDTSALTPMNLRVHNKAHDVISEIITNEMDGYAKQIAVLNWIITHSVYDPEFLSNAPTATPDPNNDNPYGVFFSQVGNCYGFTYTFQLFMDMLGIENLIVHGYDFTGGRHAWNMVNINGIWYNVDVTLDVTLNNPLGVDITHRPEEIRHRHLNVSNQFLWDILGHDWDWQSFPIAE